MTVSYASTRGDAPELDFADVLLTGLAADGGLYCPVEVPPLPPLDGCDTYAEVAARVIWPYIEGSTGSTAAYALSVDEFAAMVRAAYDGFRHPDVCPVVELGDNHFLLDLTTGPTLAFKDIALQLVGRLLDHELARRGERVVVISATSGDTGSAAIEALAGRDSLDAVVLHPYGRVSDVQRRQMTTVTASNIHNLAVEGTFDDCQDLVKTAFADHTITGRQPAAVNSINWARVVAQIVYYVTGAGAVAPDGGPVSFSVPTGNFGNVLSGWYAKRMGLAVDQLIVASNRNDVLTRFLDTGRLEARAVEPSLSPSMDIQISSNFERLLWEASGRDGAAVADLIAEFRARGRAVVPDGWVESIRAEFTGTRVSDDETLDEIARVHDELGFLIDPHTAVGFVAARRLRRDPAVPMITLATADPAKFPDAVERATGVRPPLPPFLSELFDRREHYEVVGNDAAAIAAAIARRLRGSSPAPSGQ
ncbi:MAG: threonine synthase [Acidimicrobiia bacterium]|nr:threonine synthase [Acidimicrobiia bacterium]